MSLPKGETSFTPHPERYAIAVPRGDHDGAEPRRATNLFPEPSTRMTKTAGCWWYLLE
jgi:hypothetical protein